MSSLVRKALFAWDSQTLSPLAQHLHQQGWHLVQQPLTGLKPQAWPSVGILELRTTEQKEKLEPFLGQLKRGHYLAITDNSAMRCKGMQHLVANGFRDYFTWPCNLTQLHNTLGHALGMSALCHTGVSAEQPLLLGQSAQMEQVRQRLSRFAQSDLPVLLQGESGTGKECAARMIHQASCRRREPFIAVNCAAIPDNLFVAELFGHEKGAYTGATQARRGRVHDAANGTLFLDEIGDMDASSQTTLLRFLESGHYSPLGSNREYHCHARIICASNRPLADDVERGRFRLDLYHRINVLCQSLPPLREHRDDIPELANALLSQLPGQHPLSEDAIKTLKGHDFPGNVRELRNCLWRAAALSNNGRLDPAHFGLTAPLSTPKSCCTLREFREQQEKLHLQHCLQSCCGDVQQAAQVLGISRSSLYRKLDKYQLAPRH